KLNFEVKEIKNNNKYLFTIDKRGLKGRNMKKIIWLLLGFFIVSNAIWSYCYINNAKKESKVFVQYYNLVGTGEMWDITEYKIILSPSHVFRGQGKLTYKGDPIDLEKSTYYKYEIKEINPYGIYE